ncbi:MAG: DUF1122 family protein [Candidatus Bathyarchaeota archaeon]|nr:DUF1122 family protein [Candidatus Bathyarchaeota archaeon]
MSLSIFALERKKLNNYSINICNVSPGRFKEENNFEIFLSNINEQTSIDPVIKGKYFSGRGKFYKQWLELYYNNIVRFSESVIIDLTKSKLEKKIFRYLSDILPSGSHIMIVYQNHNETKDGLAKGIPAPATPIGYLLWSVGCTWFKDWYFSEGLLEGDLKLQGNKPLDIKSRKRNLIQIQNELRTFINNVSSKESIYIKAKERGKNILQNIIKEIG